MGQELRILGPSGVATTAVAEASIHIVSPMCPFCTRGAAGLALAYPDDPEMRVSHETIYMSLFVQSGARCARN